VNLRKATKIDLLKGVPLFGGCSRAELAQIARWVDELVVPEGTVLMREGEIGREVYVIVEGSVRVMRKGRKLADFGPGSYIGDVALITRLPRGATGVTTSPARLLVMTDTAFRSVVRQSPSIALKVLESVGQRTRQAFTSDRSSG
jgi:CRP-like cAMP-binding protein